MRSVLKIDSIMKFDDVIWAKLETIWGASVKVGSRCGAPFLVSTNKLQIKAFLSMARQLHKHYHLFLWGITNCFQAGGSGASQNEPTGSQRNENEKRLNQFPL